MRVADEREAETNSVRVDHLLPLKRRVDDEIAIVRDHRSSYEREISIPTNTEDSWIHTFSYSHPQRGLGRTEDVMQVLQNLGISKWHYFNWDAWSELKRNTETRQYGERKDMDFSSAHLCTRILRSCDSQQPG